MKIVVHVRVDGPPWFKEYREDENYDRLEAMVCDSGSLRIADVIHNEFATVYFTRDLFASGTWSHLEYVHD